MKSPFIITNFKTYENATGHRAMILAKIHELVARETGVSIGIAVQTIDLKEIAEKIAIPIFAQHIDPVDFGAYTGHVLPDAIRRAGAYGTLLNHSERRIKIDIIKESVKIAKQRNLITLVCAKDPEEVAEIDKKCNPDYVAYEPPELIGGDISVSTSKPELISKAVELVGEGKLVVGAGVKNKDDVKKALELGAVGILIASGVTKADDPAETLRELVSVM